MNPSRGSGPVAPTIEAARLNASRPDAIVQEILPYRRRSQAPVQNTTIGRNTMNQRVANIAPCQSGRRSVKSTSRSTAVAAAQDSDLVVVSTNNAYAISASTGQPKWLSTPVSP